MKTWMKLTIILGQLYTMALIFTYWATNTELTNPLILLSFPGFLLAVVMLYRYEHLLKQAALEMREITRYASAMQLILCYFFVMYFGLRDALPQHLSPFLAFEFAFWIITVAVFWRVSNRPPLQIVMA